MEIRIKYEKLKDHYFCSIFARHNGNFVRISDSLILNKRDFTALTTQPIKIGVMEKSADESTEIFVKTEN